MVFIPRQQGAMYVCAANLHEAFATGWQVCGICQLLSLVDCLKIMSRQLISGLSCRACCSHLPVSFWVGTVSVLRCSVSCWMLALKASSHLGYDHHVSPSCMTPSRDLGCVARFC